MYTVKCAGEDEQIVGAELVKARVELAIENKTTSFVDYEERKDDPVKVSNGCERGLTNIVRLRGGMIERAVTLLLIACYSDKASCS
jgi:hypothetical protein